MRMRSLLVGCSLSILIGCLSQNVLAMESDEKDFGKKSLSVQPSPTISEDNFFHLCEDLLRRDVVPHCLQKETKLYLTNERYRQYLNDFLPLADVLRRNLDDDNRCLVIQTMVKSGEPFLSVMTSLGIIYNETESLMLRITSACLLNNSKTLSPIYMTKIMTDLLEEVFETQYNQGKLVKLDKDVVENFLKGVQTLSYDSDTRKKVTRRISEMSHLKPKRQFEALLYFKTGEEKDSLLLPFLKNESLKLNPSDRLDGIFGLRDGEERESFLYAFAANPRMPIEHRLEALMESSAPLDVKCEFLAQCLNNKHRFSSSVVEKIAELQFSLVMGEDFIGDESDESHAAEEITV